MPAKSNLLLANDVSMVDQPVPELPVIDVELAQRYYRDVLGFDIGWLDANKETGSVLRGSGQVNFRRCQPNFQPVTLWIFASDIAGAYDAFRSAGANIVEPIETKPWGLRQFCIDDLNRNKVYVYCDS